MHEYAVGKPYSSTRTTWPEATDFNWRGGTYELRMFLMHPTPDEVASIRTGACEFALWRQDPIALFLYRFDPAMPWSDSPFTWRLINKQRPEEATLPNPAAAAPNMLNIILVGANDGIIRAMRTLGLSPELAEALRATLASQAAAPWPGDTAYDRELAQIYSQFTTEHLAEKAIASCSFPGTA